ncbi:MAG: Fic family protein [Bacteroidales bacterium]
MRLPVDFFEYYRSVSSVYSSKIEGEEIDFDSYYKHRFLQVKFKAETTRRADDLYEAYRFIENAPLTLEHVKKAHALLSKHLLPESHRGRIRSNPMFVLNRDDRIEYVAASPEELDRELSRLFHDISLLQSSELNPFEIFYYASYLHLVFVKIHPFHDGNGRTARLIEKWFLLEKLGQEAASISLEKNYFNHLPDYSANLRKLGVEYEELDYTKALDFLLMTVQGLEEQNTNNEM